MCFFVFIASEKLVYVFFGSTCSSYVALNRMMTTMEAMFTVPGGGGSSKFLSDGGWPSKFALKNCECNTHA
jgi:hypothetical protein